MLTIKTKRVITVCEKGQGLINMRRRTSGGEQEWLHYKVEPGMWLGERWKWSTPTIQNNTITMDTATVGKQRQHNVSWIK